MIGIQAVREALRTSRKFVWLSVVAIAVVRARAGTLIVTNTADSGAGTLRQALLDANANPGLDTIIFQIPGSGVHTIVPASALPAVTDPVIIDGTTQPGYGGQPLIELSGINAGNNAGLRLLAGNTTIAGLAINKFGAAGILIQGPGSNVVVGNSIGTDVTGTSARGNGLQGIWVNGSSGNIIGGGNIISGNGDAGIYLQNAASNSVLGNTIGANAAGTAAVGNANNGISLLNGSANVIGGTGAGLRNLISGNGGSGIYLSAAVGNLLEGNYVGTDRAGTNALANAGDGITLDGAGTNTIGGMTAGAGNLISRNNEGGISLSSSTGNVIQGNFIGTDATGKAALGNLFAGVTLTGSSNNLVGGNSAGAGNVIAANKKDGVFLTNSYGNTLAGNLIGVDVTGGNPLGNGFNGVTLNNSSSNLVGGTGASARNQISGNLSYGIQIMLGATGNQIAGNYIGTDGAGQAAVGNHFSGIDIESPGNTIGGLSSGAGNVVSGNFQDGIRLLGLAASNNTVQANFVGTTLAGNTALHNVRAGIGLSDAPANLIGGTFPGAGNLVSGNGDAGIYLIGSGVTGNQVQGNIIGADNTGTTALSNARWGIYLERAATNLIGGASAGARNLISANGTWGMALTNCSWNTIHGNYIGTATDGTSPLGNGITLSGFHEVELQAGAHDNVLGGSQPGAGNRIAYAPSVGGIYYAGIRARDGSSNNLFSGNSIFSNAGLGIDLSSYLVNTNDNCDADTGANMIQNYPVLTQAVSGNGTGVRGTLNSTARSSFRLQFFANPVCDGFGNGEGQIFLGETTVTTDASCNASFVAGLPGGMPAGYVITATATDPANNTSEFSACVPVQSAPLLNIHSAPNQQVNIAWSNNVPGFVLKQTGSLSPPVQWISVTNPPAVTGGQNVVVLPRTGSNRFYVLSFE